MNADAPGAEEPPEFDAIDSHDDLVRWSAAYAAGAIREYDVAVDLDLVDWEVSTRAKRRAAAVKRPRIAGAEVGEPLDWEVAADRRETLPEPTGPADSPADRLRRCTVSLTWAAFEAFERQEWRGTLRHELVHIEQFQHFGITDHGAWFKDRADALDAAIRCRTFAAPKYLLRCGECGTVVARRYRECKLARNHERYVSDCCETPLRCERPAADQTP